MPTALESRALAFVVGLGHDRARDNMLMTIREVRNSYPPKDRPELREIKEAVEWALTQPRDFSRFLTDSQTVPSFWHRYEFPNGHSASVIVDPRPQHPFRFEVESSDPDDIGRGGIVPGLSTSEVEAKLAEIAALPDTNPTS